MERENSEDPGVDGRMVLKLVLKCNGEAWTIQIWLTVGTGGGLLWMRNESSDFMKYGEFFNRRNLLASEEGLRTMGLDGY